MRASLTSSRGGSSNTWSRSCVLGCVGCAAGAVLVWLPAAAAGAQEVALRADGSAVYRWDADDVIPARNHLITSIPGTFTGADVAPIIGAHTFYAHGYTGAGTIASNVEAGHVWNGHEALGHVTSRTNSASAPGAAFGTPAFDRHATWVGMMIGGRQGGSFPAPYQAGIAAQTDLRSGAIATNWNGSAFALGFTTSAAALAFPYSSSTSGFGAADVINSSYGATSVSGSAEAGGSDIRTTILDSLAAQNRFTTQVISAGNDGAGPNPMVSAPGSGYNALAVGALQNDGSNNYNAVAGFSSRGPNDYRDPVNGHVLAATARRAAVDLVAPGTNLTSGFYGGRTGGNDASLPGSVDPGAPPNAYNSNLGGTSFAAPVAAGAVALMHQAAVGEGLSANAEDTRVIKANLINAARKIPGWNNGQAPHPNGNGGVRTTDALDMTSGGGALDLTRTWTQYTQGQADVAGTAGGFTPDPVGWDYAAVNLGGTTDLAIGQVLAGEFRATLTWFRERQFVNATTQTDVGFANLNLQVWDATFTNLISESVSTYGETEHLAFTLPADGLYALRVAYPGNVFGSLTSEEFGLAWYGTAVPEPRILALAAVPALAVLGRARRRAQRGREIPTL